MNNASRMALEAIQAGMSVIPVRPDGSKAPAVPSWREFQSRRASEEDVLNWAEDDPGYGIIGGEISGNLLVLDFDIPGFFERWEQLGIAAGMKPLLDRLPLVETPSGGNHLYVRGQSPVGGNQKLAMRADEVDAGTPGAQLVGGKWCKIKTAIETRGEGGYVLAPGCPPACHPTNKPYRLLHGSLTDIPVVSSEELKALLSFGSALNEHIPPGRVWDEMQSFGIRRSGRLRPGDDFNERGDVPPLLMDAGWKEMGGGNSGQWQRPGKEGPGISATFNHNDQRVFYVFSTNAAPFEPDRGYKPFTVYTLLKHGGDFNAATKAAARMGFGDPLEPATDLQGANLQGAASRTDLGNAERLVNRHGTALRYSEGLDWLHWDDVRWRPVSNNRIMALAKDTIRSLHGEATASLDSDQGQTLAMHAIRCMSEARLRGMVNLAASEPGIEVAADALDGSPWLLNVLNGTVDLRTGELRPHDRADLLTKLAPVTHDPAADCPTFRAFLERILPDPELRAYLQRALGYGMTGEVSEQCLFFFYGSGANGKSTLLNVLADVLGDYYMQASPDLLTVKDKGHIPVDVAELKGTRVAATIEGEEGRAMAEALVKQITGGDRIKARRLYRDPFEFSPTHKIILAANHRPTIRGMDHGIWRRIKLVPFTVTIPDGERDIHLGDKLRTEAPGILNWLLDGCREWQQTGLREPMAIRDATAEYRAEMDHAREFFEMFCVFGADFSVTGKELFSTYYNWCRVNNDVALGKMTFNRQLVEYAPSVRSVKNMHPHNTRGWQGVKLKNYLDAPLIM